MTAKILHGNYAIAYGVLRVFNSQPIPGVISVYPITPQTQIPEKLHEFSNEGILNAKIINVESEHSAMAACIGAVMAGVPTTFTASSGQGILYMTENVYWAAGLRVPMLLANIEREVSSPWALRSGQTDFLSQRDSGGLQFFCETAQEALDTLIQLDRITKYVKLLGMLSITGFETSHTLEKVDIPEQELVNEYITPYKPKYKLDPSDPHAFGGLTLPEAWMAMKYKASQAMEEAIGVAKEADEKFYKIFGRKYGLIEKYGYESELENPSTVLVTAGSLAGTIKEYIENLKEKNKNEKVGLLRLRMFRPFPKEEIVKALEDVKKVVVLDRNSAGVLSQEVSAALQSASERPKVFNIRAGIGGVDVRLERIKEILDGISKPSWQKKEAIWILEKIEEPTYPSFSPINLDKSECMFSGHGACPGCGSSLAMRHIAKTLGERTIMVIPASCWTLIAGNYPFSSLKFPVLHIAFASAAAAASGIKAGLLARGDRETIVSVFAGDGATYDIGLAAVSAAAERGECIIYICNNNQAYMNTGTQASGATPYGAWTTTTLAGKPTKRKNMPEIMAAHKIPYVATISISHLDDLAQKVEKAKKVVQNGKGMAYLEILSPCQPGWQYPSNLTVHLAKLAVESGAWPLYEVENGEKWIINHEPKFLSVGKYLKLQGRFKHPKKEDVEAIQEDIYKEWAYLRNKPN